MDSNNKNNLDILKFLVIIWLPIFLSGFQCEFENDVSFVIQNNTSQSITIENGSTSRSIISSQTKLTVLRQEDQCCGSTENRLDNLTEIPMDSLVIFNEENKIFNKDISDIENWNRNLLTSDATFGFVTLSVEEGDFE